MLIDNMSLPITSNPACRPISAKRSIFDMHRLRRVAREQDHELIPTHSRDVIVFATVLAKHLGHAPEHTVSFQVAELIVDLFESIQIAHQDGKGLMFALGAFELAFQMKE